MAQVPISNQPLESRPVSPGYQSDAAATADAFGAVQAQSLQRSAGQLDKFSNQLGEEAVAEAKKRDAVARARDLGIFGTQAQQALYTMKDAQDMTDPATVPGYATQLDKLQQDIINNHTGGPESKQMLAARIQAHRTEFLTTANVLAQDAQETLVQKTIGDQLKPITDEAYRNPGNITDLMARADGAIADLAPGIGTTKAAALTNGARQDIMKSSVQALIDTGRFDQAQKVLDDNDGILSADVQRNLRSHITIGQVAADKAKAGVNAVISQATAILGRAPTDEERKVLVGLAKPYDPNLATPAYAPTPAETIAAFEKATGRPATDQEKAIAFGLAKAAPTGGAGGEFGNGLRGRSLGVVTHNAAAFAAGLLSPEDDREYIAATTQLQAPFPKLDPDTGVMQQVTLPVPPFVVDAFRQRGMPLPVTNGAAVLPSQGGGAAVPAAAGPTGVTAPVPVTPPAPDAPPVVGGAGETTATGHPTIWSLNGKGLVTGPIPAATELAHRAPGVGGFVPGDQMTEARNYVELQSRQLVQALQNNPRYSAIEMKDIEKELDILPRHFDSREAYAARLLSVDNFLAEREAQAVKRGTDMSLDSNFRQQARNVANLIQNFRDILGAPPVLTPEQYKAAPPGTAFRKKGDPVSVFVKPGAQGAQ